MIGTILTQTGRITADSGDHAAEQIWDRFPDAETVVIIERLSPKGDEYEWRVAMREKGQ